MTRGVLSIDHGLRLGWAWSDSQRASLGFQLKEFQQGSVDVDRRRHLADLGGAYVYYESWLLEQLGRLPTRVIVFEAPVPFSGGGIATRLLGGLATITELVARRSDIPVFEKAANSVKKFACANGRADKAMMMEAARRRGWKPQDHNACDALWLLAYTLEA